MTSPPDPDFQLIESMLWKNRYFLLAEHLRRLEDSSKVLGFNFQRESIEACLKKLEKTKLTNGKHYKIRLLEYREGSLAIETEEIQIQKQLSWNCAVSAVPTSSSDIYLYHKTTNRNFYNAELKKYRQSGYDEVLFCNEHGEITEGSVTNILAKIQGKWVTPEVSCGLLAGVYRGHLLQRMKERLYTARISLPELRRAEKIFICNSVRGCIRVGKLEFTKAIAG